MWQIKATRLLAGLNQHDAACTGYVLLLQPADCGQRGKQRIAVIGAPTTIELLALQNRRPWTQMARPAAHLRLLVEMAVQQHAVVRLTGDIDVDEWCSAAEANHFDLHASNRL